MIKLLKTVGKILLGLLTVIFLFLAVVFIYHRIMLEKEKPLLEQPLGQLVEVDGHNMCVYTQECTSADAECGEHTLLFLSGSGTASPILDFRTLYNLLGDKYNIVVVEKFGYGFSDVVDEERSFDTILRQDREALEKAGVKAPYILCPHSMSGLEAILWAQTYPDEVEGIVGLDMVVPRNYDDFDFDSVMKYEKLASAAREMGLIRFYYTDHSLPAGLTQEEKNIYKAIAARKAVNIDIVYEGEAIPAACSEIDSRPVPDVPTLMFVSDGTETNANDWIKRQHDYAEPLSDSEVIELGCGHYVHDHKPEMIAEKIREFTDKLEREI